MTRVEVRGLIGALRAMLGEGEGEREEQERARLYVIFRDFVETRKAGGRERRKGQLFAR